MSICGRDSVSRMNVNTFTRKNSCIRFSFFCNSYFPTFMALKKKLQDILRRTFNLMSTMALSMQKCKKRVVPRRGNENHFLDTFSWFTLWPTVCVWYLSPCLSFVPCRIISSLW